MTVGTVLLEAEASAWGKIVEFVKSQIPSSGVSLTMGEKLSLAGEMILRGMGTVFIVLALLWAIIAIFGAVSKATAGKAKKSAPVQPEAVAEVTASEDDGEIVAAIMAAIEAYRAGEGLAGRGYRVVSFKKRSVKNRIGSDD